jgi:hypothetical protein
MYKRQFALVVVLSVLAFALATVGAIASGPASAGGVAFDPGVLVPFAGLILGCAMRTLLPYVVTGFETVSQAESWRAWPQFVPSYLASFALAVLAYAVTSITIPGVFENTKLLGFVPAVGMAYMSQDLSRLVVKGAAAIKHALINRTDL